ncbi:hypothetical protein BU17DRAFT_87223 [Hysterangium stoloniferum]|nr:hypothetical protein BU17DRAFT_87223 [Hysterangium stoloniferum]
MSNIQPDASFSQAGGQKRGRSPSPALSDERPTKRVYLDSDSAGSTPPLGLGQQPCLRLNAPSNGLFECSISDDWVTKTGGLKLDSPLFAIGQSLSTSLPGALLHTADNLNDMGNNHEPMITDSPKWNPQHYTENNQAFTPFSSPHHESPSSPMDMSPRTHEPTTPTNCRRRQFTEDHSPMSLTPSHPGAWSPSTTNQLPRKPRITMGPRADCEKCRLGIKGHWMHLN